MYVPKQVLAPALVNVLLVMPKETMETIVYSKEDCPACDKLKAQLARGGEEFTEIKVGVDITREEFIAKFPQVRSMPHVIFKDVE